jgi:hypothetical protein
MAQKSSYEAMRSLIIDERCKIKPRERYQEKIRRARAGALVQHSFVPMEPSKGSNRLRSI